MPLADVFIGAPMQIPFPVPLTKHHGHDRHHHEQRAEGEAEAVAGRMFDINTKILYTI